MLRCAPRCSPQDIQDDLEETAAVAEAEWMARVACLARASAARSLPLLVSLVKDTRQRLAALIAQGRRWPAFAAHGCSASVLGRTGDVGSGRCLSASRSAVDITWQPSVQQCAVLCRAVRDCTVLVVPNTS